jgi:hypothetical protein
MRIGGAIKSQHVARPCGLAISGLYYTSHAGCHRGVRSRHVQRPLSPAAHACTDTVVGMVGLVALVVWLGSLLL